LQTEFNSSRDAYVILLNYFCIKSSQSSVQNMFITKASYFEKNGGSKIYTFWLVVRCLLSSGKYFMDIQKENKFNNI